MTSQIARDVWPFKLPEKMSEDAVDIAQQLQRRAQLRIRARSRTTARMIELDTRPWHRFGEDADKNTFYVMRAAMKNLGFRIRSWCNNPDRSAHDLANILNEADFSGMREGKMCHTTDIISALDTHAELAHCDHCRAVAHGDDMQSADVNRTEISICTTCSENSTFVWSDAMDIFIKRSDSMDYYATQYAYDMGTSDLVTRRWANSNSNVIWNDVNSFYYHESISLDSNDREDEYSDDGDDDDDDGLADYHDSNRNFEIHQVNPHAIYRNMPPLGLELEVYASERWNAVQSMRNFRDAIGEIILERDGSLSEEHGFEIITDPLGYTEWQMMGPKLCEKAKKTCVAYQHPDDNNYGIHITLSRQHLSPLQEARMMLFMTATENADFMRVISQREGIYSARVDIGSMEKARQTIFNLGQLGEDPWNGKRKKIQGCGKYAPINFKDYLAEIRIFQATLHTPSFMKNLEFVWALIEWVRDSSGSNWHHLDFVKWLGKRGTARHDYSNLYDYLIRPTYGVKNYYKTIRNTWSRFLPLPNPTKGVIYVPPQPVDDEQLRHAA